MTERLDEKLRAARTILERLREGPMRWTPLIKYIVSSSPSPWKAQTMLHWLLRQGYIDRPERGLYIITEKGKQLLEFL